jgi:hypothetical protein
MPASPRLFNSRDCVIKMGATYDPERVADAAKIVRQHNKRAH